MSLRKSSKRTNPEWHFKIFTFASQRRLVELLSYGEYNHLFISVICFLKATNLSVHRFQWLIFFPLRKNQPPTSFFCSWNILITATPFWKHWIIYNWINFSQWYPCCETNFGKTKNLKNSTTLLCKRFLRIISIKLFVIWQVLKPALQKLNLEGFFQNPKMTKS